MLFKFTLDALKKPLNLEYFLCETTLLTTHKQRIKSKMKISAKSASRNNKTQKMQELNGLTKQFGDAETNRLNRHVANAWSAPSNTYHHSSSTIRRRVSTLNDSIFKIGKVFY